MRRKWVCYLLVAILAGAMLIGCGKDEQVSVPPVDSTATESEISKSTEMASEEPSEKESETEEVVEKDVVASGSLTDANIQWEIIGTTLYVRGEGEIPDFIAKSTEAQDWQVYRDITQKVVIEDGITKIGKGNFYYFYNLQEAILADSVKEIGVEGFYYTGLEAIDLKNVIILGDRAFANNHSLASVTIPGAIENIPLQCFGGSENLNEVYIEEGVRTLQATSFFDMGENLVLHLPSTITYIHDEAWSNDLTVCVKAGSYAESYANEVAHRDNLTVIVE